MSESEKIIFEDFQNIALLTQKVIFEKLWLTNAKINNFKEAKIKELVSQLGEIEYGNIEIKPFKIEIDGFQFGLIPNEESEMIELQPSNTLAFEEPWDGEYWT